MKKYIAIITMFLLVFVLGMRKAEAVPTATMEVYDGATLIATITDQEADLGDPFDNDLSGTLGGVVWSGNFGVWSIEVNTGATKPANGTATNPKMHLTIAATSSSAGSLTVKFSDTDFSPSPLPASVELTSGGSGIGTASTTGYVDTTNTIFGTETAIGPVPLVGTVYGSVGASPFSMTIVTTLTHAGAGASSVDVYQNVPEPATLLLMGAGLLGLGIFGRKKIKG